MALIVGAQLNHYSITGTLGEGGMGTVYAAEDTQLGRHVAIKVLPPKVAADPERLQRFEREARTIASLNHPNVVTLYSVERSEQTRFLTMELVDGEALSDIIVERGVSIREFFRVALPLVEAVASAHAQGITHRDLKPSNIMLDRDSRVKVLDFGLAKLTQGSPLASDSDSDSELPTDVMTGAGQIVGTVAYMAPEQAEGKQVDARSDIFSLGVVFYEMITGRRPFRGESPVSTLSAILLAEPEPVTSVRNGVPRQLQRILDRCLAKAPSRRFQTALDLRNALDALRDELRTEASDEFRVGVLPSGQSSNAADAPMATAEQTEANRETKPLTQALRAAALLTAGAILGAGAITMVRPERPAVADADTTVWTSLPLVAAQDLMPAWPALSPNGDWVVFAADENGQTDLWRVPTGGGETVRLTNTPESEAAPEYSPDGTSIAYAVESGDQPGIYLAPAETGAGVMVIPGGTRPSWSPSGDRIAYVDQGSLWVTQDADFGNPQQKSNYLGGPLDPAWSPTEDALLAWSEVELDVIHIPLDDPLATTPLGLVPTGEQVSSLQVTRDGSALFMTRGQYGGRMDVWRVPLDPATGTVAGDPERLTEPITDDRNVAISGDGSHVAFLARDGERHLYSLPLDPTTGLWTGAQELLTRRAPLNYYPALSRDGSALTWTAQTIAGFLYRKDLLPTATGTLALSPEVKVTPDWNRQAREITGDFSLNGEEIVFSSTAGGAYHLRRSRCPACLSLPLTTPLTEADYYPNFSPDGLWVAFTSTRAGSEDIWVVPSAGGEPRRVTKDLGAEQYPEWSPDGERLLYRSVQGADVDIWSASLDGTDARPEVARDGDQTWAFYSPDGNRLYFASNESGPYEIWMRDANGNHIQVTTLGGTRGGMPSEDMFTKFAVGTDRLIVPLETVSGEIWLLESSAATLEPPGPPAENR